MIKYLLILLILTFGLTGCSLLPRLTFEKSGVTPQSTVKSTKKESCSGEYKTNDKGDIVSCSKGYNNYENNYTQKERAYTLAERIGNFIRSLAGWGFWLLVLVVILCPGLIGWAIGSVFNVAKAALTGTVKAIGNFKKNTPKIIVNGQEVDDPNYVKAVDALLDELETEHSKDPGILKTISDIRLKLKIEDND